MESIEEVAMKAKAVLTTARFFSQDPDGFWCVYKSKPEFDYLFDSWMPSMDCLSYQQIMRTALFPNHRKNLFII